VWGGCSIPLPTGNTPPHCGRSWGWAFFLFCDLKMAYFGEFWGSKFKLFLYRELPQWGSGRFCGKFWIFEQNNAWKTPLNAVIGRGRLILVCYIRTYVIILVGIFPLTSPNQNIGEDVFPASPAGLTPVYRRLTLNSSSPLWLMLVVRNPRQLVGGPFLCRVYVFED